MMKWLLLGLFITGTAGSFWNLHQRQEQLSRDYPLQGTALNSVTLQEFRKLYTEEVVRRLEPLGIEAVHDYHNRDQAIPLPATLTMELGNRINTSRAGAHIFLYSDYPFPWRKDGGPRDEFQREALAAVRQQPERPFYRFEEFQGRASLRYAVADQMQAACVSCHNSHPDSPKKDWQVGDVRGVMEFIRPLDCEVAEGRRARLQGLFITLGMAGLGLVGLGLLYFRLQRTAASLGVSESRKRAILESALDCIITMDHEGKVLDFNPAAERTFGYRREDTIGKLLSDLIIPPEVRQAHERGLRQYLTTGEGPLLGKPIEIMALRAGGTKFPVELTVEVFRQNGLPVFTGYLRDLTERKQVEAALVERARLATLTADVSLSLTRDDNPQAILQHCTEVIVRHLDAAFARIWTLNDKEQVLELQASAGLYTHLNGPHGRVAVGQFKIGKIAQERQPHLTNHVIGDPRVGDQEWARREGMVAFAGYPLIVGERLVGVMAMFARQLLPETTLAALGVVADGIALGIERFQVQQGLIRAREEKVMAEAANQAKNEFLSRMSHELRTPLNAILGFGQLLEMNALTDDQRECVGQINRGGKHLLGLINEVLDIARIEAGRLDLSPEPVRVADTFQEVLDLVRPLGAQRDLQFKADGAGANGHFVLADNQKLKQVLLNLLSNAVKYNRDRGEVTLSCEQATPGRLRLAVSDTGPGIAPEKLARLFVPFDRLGAEQTEVEGSGLGLALSKRLVELMGGTLTVTSAVGEGSRFCVELAQAEAPQEWGAAGGEEVLGSATVTTEARTVLYIEDNLDNLRLVQRILAHRPGVQLVTAIQGSLGIDLARQHQPDLILLDVNLPDLNGERVLLRLKAAPETRSIPVIVISADATPRQIERLYAAGAWNYLTKPIDVPHFLGIVDEVLK